MTVPGLENKHEGVEVGMRDVEGALGNIVRVGALWSSEYTYEVKRANRTGEDDTGIEYKAACDDRELCVFEVLQRVHRNKHIANNNHGNHGR